MIIYRNHRKKCFYTILSSSILFCFYLFLTPYISILNFKNALDKKNIFKAKSYIDFPLVRMNLKNNLKIQLQNRFSKDKSMSTVTSFLITPAINVITNSVVDNIVNKNGLSILLNTSELSKDFNVDNNVLPNNEISQKSLKKKNKLSFTYSSPNMFILSSKNEQYQKPLKAYWQRRGLVEWKLISIELPIDMIDYLR